MDKCLIFVLIFVWFDRPRMSFSRIIHLNNIGKPLWWVKTGQKTVGNHNLPLVDDRISHIIEEASISCTGTHNECK